MEWHSGEAIITVCGAEPVDGPLPSPIHCVMLAARPALCPYQGALWIMQARRAEGVGNVCGHTEAGLTGTPVVLGGVLGAHGPGRSVRR